MAISEYYRVGVEIDNYDMNSLCKICNSRKVPIEGIHCPNAIASPLIHFQISGNRTKKGIKCWVQICTKKSFVLKEFNESWSHRSHSLTPCLCYFPLLLKISIRSSEYVM